MRLGSKIATVMMGLALLASPALAQKRIPVKTAAIDLQALDLDVSMQRKMLNNPDKFLQDAIKTLSMLADDGLLRVKDLQARTDEMAAKRRQSRALEFKRTDKDGDGILSTVEIRERIAFLSDAEKGKFAGRIVVMDVNLDGNVSAAEIEVYLDAQPDPDFTKLGGAKELLSFDVDRNGEVDAQEITRVVRAVVAKRAITRPKGERPQAGDRMDQPLTGKAKEMLSCGYPAPSEAAEVVIVSTYSGYALSTVALGDTQQVTTVAVLDINEGKTPLYLVTGSTYPVIFDLRGAVERIEQIVTGPLNGIVGVDPQKVYSVPDGRGGCIPRRQSKSGSDSSFARSLATVMIKDRVQAVNTYRMGVFGVPLGGEQLAVKRLKTALTAPRKNRWIQVERPQGGYRAATPEEAAVFKLNNQLRRRNPAGVSKVAVRDVVASRAVIPYVVLPQEAGLIQMINDGDIRVKRKTRLTIVRGVRELPADLGRIRILIEPGVPLPKVQPMNVFVFDEVSGDCVSGEACLKN